MILCLHQVYFGCMIEWTVGKQIVPLCVGLLQCLKFLVWVEDDFLDETNMPTTELFDASSYTKTGLNTETPTIFFPKDTMPQGSREST